ncbi:hypothetical protein K440DRAFT_594554 [Wilcoxina mikolae CBS 423.85]|nr:hypothetical protein K440DRAFT_594554 [Wilcoxina mikolae CBS 423.85]
MPVIRNPFRKNAPPPVLHSSSSSSVIEQLSPFSGEIPGAFQDNDSKSTSAISIIKSDDEKNSYKMSVVNDSGVYLPPSPQEKKSFWKRENSSSGKNRPPIIPPEEQFTISRESFDSYRRSFDISARSPISDTAPGRTSFDTRPYGERASLDVRPSTSPLILPAVKVVEEPDDDGFEEVKLDDPRPKKLGIFARFGGDHGSKEAPKDGSRPRSGIFSRKDHSFDIEHESELKKMDKDEK